MARRVTAQDMFVMGHKVWQETYKVHPNDDFFAVMHGAKMADELGAEQPALDGAEFASLARWVDGGCRVLDTSEKYFAAMACTNAASGMFDDLRIPWPAFVVRVPGGLLSTGTGETYSTWLVCQLDRVPCPPGEGEAVEGHLDFDLGSRVYFSSWSDTGPEVRLHGITAGTLAKVLEPTPFHSHPGVDPEDGDESILGMFRRAVVGLLLTMQHTTHFRASAFSGVTRGKLRDAPPPHRAIVIGRPMKIDCTSAVRESATGHRRGPPSVQTMVRGHVKRQVVGPGRVGRKVVWIEPYWRGPELAPILSRPYIVGKP